MNRKKRTTLAYAVSIVLNAGLWLAYGHALRMTSSQAVTPPVRLIHVMRIDLYHPAPPPPQIINFRPEQATGNKASSEDVGAQTASATSAAKESDKGDKSDGSDMSGGSEQKSALAGRSRMAESNRSALNFSDIGSGSTTSTGAVSASNATMDARASRTSSGHGQHSALGSGAEAAQEAKQVSARGEAAGRASTSSGQSAKARSGLQSTATSTQAQEAALGSAANRERTAQRSGSHSASPRSGQSGEANLAGLSAMEASNEDSNSPDSPDQETPAEHKTDRDSQVEKTLTLHVIKMWAPQPGQKLRLATNLRIILPPDVQVIPGRPLTEEQVEEVRKLLAQQTLHHVDMDKNVLRKLLSALRMAQSEPQPPPPPSPPKPAGDQGRNRRHDQEAHNLVKHAAQKLAANSPPQKSLPRPVSPYLFRPWNTDMYRRWAPTANPNATPAVQAQDQGAVSNMEASNAGVPGKLQLPGAPDGATTNDQNGLAGQQGNTGQNGTAQQNAAAGLNGMAGQQGAGGQNGVAGQQGAGGQNGVAGQQGAGGQNGMAGQQGAGGQNGMAGQQGAGGQNGMAGQQGAGGQNGMAGQQGAGGQNGMAGQEGAGGQNGMAGQQGAGGQNGMAGQQGAGGQNGMAGQQGAGGQNGMAGQQGAGGQNGMAGQQGAGGQNGMAGQQGAGGQNGMAGQQGAGGQNGMAGQQGAGGQNGPGGQQAAGGQNGMAGQQGAGGQNAMAGQQGAGGQNGGAGQQDNGGQNGMAGQQGAGGQNGMAGQQGAGGQNAMAAQGGGQKGAGQGMPQNNGAQGAQQGGADGVASGGLLASEQGGIDGIDGDNPNGVTAVEERQDNGMTDENEAQAPDLPMDSQGGKKGIPGALVLPPAPPEGTDSGKNPIFQKVRHIFVQLASGIFGTGTQDSPRQIRIARSANPTNVSRKPVPPPISIGSTSTHGDVSVAVASIRPVRRGDRSFTSVSPAPKVPGANHSTYGRPQPHNPQLASDYNKREKSALVTVELIQTANNSHGMKIGTDTPLPPTPMPDSDMQVGDGSGLKGDYYIGRRFNQFVFSRADANINFQFDQLAGGSPSPRITPGSEYTVRWTGKIAAKYSETYTMYATVDDGVRVWIDHKLVLDDWTDHAPTQFDSKFRFEAGRQYDFKVEYLEIDGGQASVRLYWQSPSQPREFIPEDSLFYPLPSDEVDMRGDKAPL